MKAQLTIPRNRVMHSRRAPDLARALRPVPRFERAVRELSRMFAAAGIRHALVGALGANAYRNRPRTTEDIQFLVGDEAFQIHPEGFVTLRVPVIEFEGIDVDQVPSAATFASSKTASTAPSRARAFPLPRSIPS